LRTLQLEARVESPFCASEGLAFIRGDNRLYVVDINRGWVDWELSLDERE